MNRYLFSDITKDIKIKFTPEQSDRREASRLIGIIKSLTTEDEQDPNWLTRKATIVHDILQITHSKAPILEQIDLLNRAMSSMRGREALLAAFTTPHE